MFVVELWRKLSFLGLVYPHALADKLEAACDSERGRSKNDGVERFKQAFAQNLADVNGRGRQKNTFVPALKPVDVISFVGLEQKRELLANLETATRDSKEFFRFIR